MKKEKIKFVSFPDSNPNPVLEIGSKNNILYANPAAKKIFSKLLIDRKHHFYKNWKSATEKITKNKLSLLVIETSKKGFWYEQSIVAVPGSNRFRIYFRDITKRKIIENNLRKDQKDLRHAQIFSKIGNWRMNILKDKLTWSEENYHIFGVRPDTPLNYKKFLSLVHPDDRKYVDQKWNDALESGHYEVEHRILAKDKTIKWLSEKAELEFNKNGKLISGFGTTQDITDEKKIEKDKTEFISLASHQLRTPLTEISLSLEMLESNLAGKLIKEDEEYVNNISEGISEMKELIEMFLDISRIEMGTILINPEPINLSAFLNNSLKSFLEQIRNKNLVLKRNYDSNLPYVNLDPKLLSLIFDNLISNSVKYTEKGEIVVKVSKYKKGLLIKISDTGCGIPKNQHDKVFSKLNRTDNYLKDKVKGTGLGLYIAKIATEQIGGNIYFQSKEKKGTSFYLFIPSHKTIQIN